MPEKIALRYRNADNGNCRVYYRGPHSLFCWQLAGRGTFELFLCSRDGEPSYNADPAKFTTPPPEGDEAIERELRQFLAAIAKAEQSTERKSK